jgi:translation initiation factor 1
MGKKKKKIVILSDEDSKQQNGTNEDIPLEDIKWRLRIEKKGRGGKVVTIVDDNMECSETQILELAKVLKQYCGVGGSVKEEGIVLQGDVRPKVVNYMRSKGFRNVK